MTSVAWSPTFWQVTIELNPSRRRRISGALTLVPACSVAVRTAMLPLAWRVCACMEIGCEAVITTDAT